MLRTLSCRHLRCVHLAWSLLSFLSIARLVEKALFTCKTLLIYGCHSLLYCHTYTTLISTVHTYSTALAPTAYLPGYLLLTACDIYFYSIYLFYYRVQAVLDSKYELDLIQLMQYIFVGALLDRA